MELTQVRTAGFAEVEPEQDQDDTGDDEEQPHEVELFDVLVKALALMGVQVQEEEQQGKPDTTRGPTRDIVLVFNVTSRATLDDLQVDEETPGVYC